LAMSDVNLNGAQATHAVGSGALGQPAISAVALPHIAPLHAYTPGIQPTEPGWTKLNTNECPYPPSPRVAEALLKEIGPAGESLRLYPNPTSAPLRATVAALHKVTPAQVCIGNGSDDILNLLVRVCCGSDAPSGAAAASAVAYTYPSYSLYPVLIAIQNGKPEVIPFDRSMTLPLEQIAASSAKLFLLTSPNAPTGVGFTRAEIAAALAVCPGLLVVDEAYAPFADEDAIPLLQAHRNLVITRTLSKAYALAGIRVGYALADPEVIGWLDRVRDSYNVSRLSQVAAIAALKDTAYHADIVARIRATRDRCYQAWSQDRGWFTYRSSSNFLFTEPKNARGETGPAVAQAAYEFLLGHKILVRYFPNHALTASFLRVSVGTDDEMRRLNSTLDAWLKQSNAA